MLFSNVYVCEVNHFTYVVIGMSCKASGNLLVVVETLSVEVQPVLLQEDGNTNTKREF